MSTTRTLITPRPEPLAGHLDPLAAARSLWRARHLVVQLGLRRVRTRHRGSFLGVSWAFFNPLLLLAVYTFVFGQVFELADEAGGIADFALRVFCGMAFYGIFAETLSKAPTSIVAHPNFVKKVVFPLETLPVIDLFESACFGLAQLGILALAAIVLAGSLGPTWLLFPLLLPPLFLLTAGLAWILASLGVFVRDVGSSIGVLLTMLFFLTPIFYSIDDIGSDTVRSLMRLNPLAVLIEGARRTLLQGQAPHWPSLAVAYVVSLLVAQAGYAWFQATKRGFPDVV